MSSAEPNGHSLADEWVDTLVPEEVNWRELVRDYPTMAVGAAVVGGFLLGWLHGDRIVSALSEAASERVNEAVDRFTDHTRGLG